MPHEFFKKSLSKLRDRKSFSQWGICNFLLFWLLQKYPKLKLSTKTILCSHFTLSYLVKPHVDTQILLVKKQQQTKQKLEFPFSGFRTCQSISTNNNIGKDWPAFSRKTGKNSEKKERKKGVKKRNEKKEWKKGVIV